MENLSFVIWMVGYSLTSTISTYCFWLHDKSMIKPAAEWTYGITSLIHILIWIYVGKLLYVRPL